MTAAIHSIVDTARKASREAELSVLHVQAIIAELRVQFAELRRDRDFWHDLAEAWMNRRTFDAEQAQRLAESAGIRAEGAVTTR
jgi:hypothetical protein